MNITPTSGERYPIVLADTPALAVGTVVYKQSAAEGAALGMLLSLTVTAQYIKCIKTANGLRKIL